MLATMREVACQSSWMKNPYCFSGMFADASPSFSVTTEMGPLRVLSRCVYWNTPLPELNVMKRRGSLMKFTPALKSCPRPPPPAMCQEKSSRNWNLCCSVVCGVLGLWPADTPLGKSWNGSVLAALMWLAKSAYWKMNSFSFDPPSTQLWFTLIELNVLPLSPHALGAVFALAPYGWLLVLRP